MSQDMATKPQLVRYGGYGYAHIVRDILPSLRYRGVPEYSLTRMLEENPRRFLGIS